MKWDDLIGEIIISDVQHFIYKDIQKVVENWEKWEISLSKFAKLSK